MPSADASSPAPASRFLTGLIGKGILQSRSPWLHECEGAAQGLRLTYSLFDFTDRGWGDDHLPKLLDALQLIGFAGVNVTFPFKQAIIALLDDLSDSARALGAVNTVVFDDGRRIGHNTDVTGFATSLLAGLDNAPRAKVLQLGCGGAGSATAHALLQSGVGTLLLHDVETDKCAALVRALSALYGADRVAMAKDVSAAEQADGIVNATPVGMDKFPGLPLPAGHILPHHWVADIVYFPLETPLLKEARAKGCRTLNGSGMAIHQAAGAFSLFTGRAPDIERMAQSFSRPMSCPSGP